jgi:hypothetical protein
MSRYAQADEEKIRNQALVREWTRSGLLDGSQKDRIETELHVDLRRTNHFLRAVLFVFTCLIVAASMALIITTLHLDDKIPMATTCFAAAMICYGLAECLINRFRLYRFGVEEALAVCAVLLTALGAVAVTDTIRENRTLEIPIIIGLSVGAVGALAIYKRLGYLYAALVAMLCASALPFQFHLSIQMERGLVVSFLLLIFLTARSSRLPYGDDFPGDDYAVIQATAAAGIYLASNLRLTDTQATGTFYWLTYALIWLIPIVTLTMSLRGKDRPLLDVSLGMALATLVTNKSYLGLPHQPWDPILFGVFLIVIAITVRRRLSNASAGRRHGFTSARVLTGDRRLLSVVGTASAVLQSDIPTHASAPAKPEFGGGRSGGAGASGSF